MGGMLDGEVG